MPPGLGAPPDLVKAFDSNGWAIVEGVFGEDEMDALADVARVCCDEEMQGKTICIVDGAGGDVSALKTAAPEADAEAAAKRWAMGQADKGANGELLPRKLNSPFLKHALFQKVAAGERLVGLASSFLRGTAPLLLTDQAFMKPPKYGTPKPYHQDNYYFGLANDADCLTCWVALDDADEENGCLRYINGSHKGGIIPHIVTDPDAPFNKDAPPEAVKERAGGEGMPGEALAVVKKGGVVFHSGATLHASGPNTSTRWRRGYAVHMGAGDATFSRDLPDGEEAHLATAAYCFQPWFATVVSSLSPSAELQSAAATAGGSC